MSLPSLLDRALDASVVLSFDRTGFRRHARRFGPGDLDVDLGGRATVVTGANSGIGRETARALAARGARTWLLCRREEAGREAERALRAETGNPEVHFARLDVSHLADVRRLAAELRERRVDVLVHNAGVLPDARRETPEGLELTFATHVAGPALLTRLLEERLAAADRARVVFVSSGGMYTTRLDLRDLQWSERPWDGVRAYAQTRRMQVVLARELGRRLGPRGIRVHAMHPGWAATPAVRRSLPGFWRVTRAILRTPAEGADTVIWLAASRAAGRARSGFWFDRRPASPWWIPATRETPAERRSLLALVEAATASPGAGRQVSSASPSALFA